MNHHMCETWSQHTWWLCSRPGLGALKSGCDKFLGLNQLDYTLNVFVQVSGKSSQKLKSNGERMEEKALSVLLAGAQDSE
jgi:hypothetical protein